LTSAFSQILNSDEFEVLFIDDGSTDSTPEIAEKHMDRPNFRPYRNEQNIGLVASCNRGLELAEGTWLTRLDADDALAPEMLRYVSQCIDEEPAFIYTDRKDIYWDKDEEYYVNLSNFNIFELIASGITLHRQTLLKIGGYRDLFWEEYDLYIRYLQYTGITPVHIPQPLYQYSIYQGSMTSNSHRVEEGWQELIREWGIDTLKQYGTHQRLSA
jgi:glycosyltransferase involved in cell wall biosynthesis